MYYGYRNRHEYLWLFIIAAVLTAKYIYSGGLANPANDIIEPGHHFAWHGCSDQCRENDAKIQ
jgi:hypothetical protein